VESEQIIRLMIESIAKGANKEIDRDAMEETPMRVAKSWKELFKGYHEEYKLKWFSSDYDEMVIVRDIDFFSTCEHHMLPFFGTADVAYIPNGAVVGLSKIARLVDNIARTFQIQERLTVEIAKALYDDNESNQPLGVAVQLKAQHLCMKARGAKQENAYMTTNCMMGIFQDDAAAKHEFLSR